MQKLVRFDWAIKYLLRNKANFSILEGFLSELLHTDVKIDAILESESNQEQERDKTIRVDLKAELSGGEKVIIEVQCVRQWDFLSRMLYGVSRVVVEHLEKGSEYGEIPKVISVNIVYFDLGHGKDYIYKGQTHFEGIHCHDRLELGEDEKKMYPETIQGVSDVYPQYYVLKVPQFKSKVQNKLDEWMYFLKESAIKPEFRAKGLSQAAKTLDFLRLDDVERRRYDRFMDNLRDEKSLVRTHYIGGREDGRIEGLAEGEIAGKIAGKIEVARNLKKLGLNHTQISEATGLCTDEIDAL